MIHKPTLNNMQRDLSVIAESAFYKEVGISEAAALLGKSERTIRNKTQRGEIPAIPNSKPFRYVWRDLVLRRKESSWNDIAALDTRINLSKT